MSDAPGRKPGRPATPADPTPSGSEVMADGAFSVEGAAAFAAALSRDEIDRAIARGEIKVCHHGRRVLIPRTVVVQWLAAKWDREYGTGACAERAEGESPKANVAEVVQHRHTEAGQLAGGDPPVAAADQLLEAHWLPGSPTVRQAGVKWGLSRDKLFELMQTGAVRFRVKDKKGTRLVAAIDVARYVATLPAAPLKRKVAGTGARTPK